MRRPLVAGNWKMNGTRGQAAALVDRILGGTDPRIPVELVVCPPFTLIALVAEKLEGRSGIACGAQNLNTHRFGAYTGEVSAPMLRDCGCQYVIVGHSERRTLYGEDDQLVAEKFGAALDAELTPILCLGESLEQREAGQTQAVVARQLGAVLAAHGIEPFRHAVIAYEPVWAIGTGKTATPAQSEEVHRFIRQRLAAMDGTIADNSRILYGGSVKAGNAQALFGETDIDGGLIGGASLDADEFLEIYRAAS